MFGLLLPAKFHLYQRYMLPLLEEKPKIGWSNNTAKENVKKSQQSYN